MRNPLLEAKLALERELERPLAHILMGYIVAKQEGLSLFGRNAWASQLNDVLLAHYARVVMVMTGRRPSRPQSLEGAALDAEHLNSLKRRGASQANLILTSVDREWDRTPETKADIQRGLYSKMLGKAREVWARVKARMGAIVSSQTNPAAEEARAREARRIAGNRGLYKWWSTMLDELVRDSHQEAEGQRRRASEAFDLRGGQLMFPGDTSLGVSLSEIINCRCSAHYVVVNADGTEQDLGGTERLTPVSPRHMTPLTDREPTQRVRMANGEFASVFLNDRTEAWFSIRNGVLRITRRNQVLAEGRFTHGMLSGPRVQGLRITPEGQGLGIEALVERSLGR